MTHPNAPNFRGSYPLAGKDIGRAWERAWEGLWRFAPASKGRWVDAEILIKGMTYGAPVQESTCRGLLSKAVAAGILEAKHTVRGTPKRKRASYRVADLERWTK